MSDEDAINYITLHEVHRRGGVAWGKSKGTLPPNTTTQPPRNKAGLILPAEWWDFKLFLGMGIPSKYELALRNSLSLFSLTDDEVLDDPVRPEIKAGYLLGNWHGKK